LGDELNNQAGALTEDEVALIERTRAAGVPAGEVKVEPPGGGGGGGGSSSSAAEPGPGGSAVTRKDVEEIFAKQRESDRYVAAKEQMRAHIDKELDKHDATKVTEGARRQMTQGLVWAKFGEAHPDSSGMNEQQIDAALAEAAKAVADEEEALRKKQGGQTDEGREAERRLKNQGNAAEGAGDGEAARTAGTGNATDPLAGTGDLEMPEIGVDASNKWPTSDEQVEQRTRREAAPLHKGIREGRIPVPTVPET
jgi:hypothetical protein